MKKFSEHQFMAWASLMDEGIENHLAKVVQAKIERGQLVLTITLPFVKRRMAKIVLESIQEIMKQKVYGILVVPPQRWLVKLFDTDARLIKKYLDDVTTEMKNVLEAATKKDEDAEYIS